MSDERLSPQDEIALWNDLKNGDNEARERIILSYRPMVFWIAKKFRVHGDIYPDLVQEGMVALINSVDNFDPSKGFRFTTYGYYRIKGQMLNFLQRKESKAPIPMEDMDEELQDPFSPDAIESVLDLRNGLSHLPEREARILSDMVLQGKSAKEIAERESMDVSHVYRLRRKALGWLRSWFLPDATTRA
ncbi:MAG: sigma-70 family RNA polymerase sigma factor [Synergistales bacterium]|nr:sigma-70 family RNA polymerase sigma factor [Synergistales bacterium]